MKIDYDNPIVIRVALTPCELLALCHGSLIKDYIDMGVLAKITYVTNQKLQLQIKMEDAPQ